MTSNSEQQVNKMKGFSRRRGENISILGRSEQQDQPLLILSTTYFLNFNGLKTITIGLRADQGFTPKIVFSHIKIPSRHVELTVEDFNILKSHFNLFSELFAKNDPSIVLRKVTDFENYSINLERLFDHNTVSLIDKTHNSKFSFQKTVFDSIVWLLDNIHAAIDVALINQSKLMAENLTFNSRPSDPVVRQALSELITYRCIQPE